MTRDLRYTLLCAFFAYPVSVSNVISSNCICHKTRIRIAATSVVYFFGSLA